MSQFETVTINGNEYTVAQIEAMDRASLRVIARLLQETKFPDVSRAWIGSMATTQDLRDFVLGRTVKADHTGTLNGNGQAHSANGSDAASLLAQAIAAIQADSVGKVSQDDLAEINKSIDARQNEVVNYVDHVTNKLGTELRELLAKSWTKVSFVVNEVEVARVEGLRHKGFDDLYADVLAFKATKQTEKANFWLTGEAGTGKTTAAKKLAELMGLPFRFNGAIDSEYKLRGFIDANGRIISTPFRLAYEFGGIYLFDEVDSSLPSACLAFNAALANGCYDFPGCDMPIPRHPDCIILAASNTWGGPTGDYVGRFKQDGAFMDRFMRVAWETDEALESALCANKDWCAYVQCCRAAAAKHGIEHIISPRATFNGDVLLGVGRPWDRVVDLCVRKGLADEDWSKIQAGVSI
jgi:ATPase family associated with various cellular activities (AAA)